MQMVFSHLARLARLSKSELTECLNWDLADSLVKALSRSQRSGTRASAWRVAAAVR